MARADLAVQDTNRQSGLLDVTYSAANADGEQFLNDGKTLLLVQNGSGSPLVVTVQTAQTVEGNAIADPTFTVAAGDDAILGPFTPSLFNQVADGKVYSDTDAQTSITVAAVRMN